MDVATFVAERLGHETRDVALFEVAVTHSSSRSNNYERLEFLGDRVLGLIIAQWLYERFPDEPEGELSQRFNTLVNRSTCSEIGRRLGVPTVVRLGKQARGDGAGQSDNIVGDVVEALVGALYVESGLEAAQTLIRRLWAPFVEGQGRAPKHPKSQLQELAAARNLPTPAYQVVAQGGTDHSPRFTVRVAIDRLGDAEADGSSKQEAETKAAAALLEKLA